MKNRKLSLKLLDELIDDVKAPFQLFIPDISILNNLLDKAQIIDPIKRDKIISDWKRNRGILNSFAEKHGKISRDKKDDK